jgi:hypothetical protein
MAQVEAQDVQGGRSYSDGKRVFKVRKPNPVGGVPGNHTHTQVITTTGRVMTFRNTDKLFDSATDIQ